MYHTYTAALTQTGRQGCLHSVGRKIFQFILDFECSMKIEFVPSLGANLTQSKVC